MLAEMRRKVTGVARRERAGGSPPTVGVGLPAGDIRGDFGTLEMPDPDSRLRDPFVRKYTALGLVEALSERCRVGIGHSTSGVVPATADTVRIVYRSGLLGGADGAAIARMKSHLVGPGNINPFENIYLTPVRPVGAYGPKSWPSTAGLC